MIRVTVKPRRATSDATPARREAFSSRHLLGDLTDDGWSAGGKGVAIERLELSDLDISVLGRDDRRGCHRAEQN
jgi:hypothetical protein